MYEVLAIPLWSITLFENPESVATWRLYESAANWAFQVSVGVVETPVAPFTGDINVGPG